MSTAVAAPVTRDFGTGLLRTQVRPLPDGGHRWHRRPGPLAPRPFVPSVVGLAERLGRSDGSAPVRWVAGRANGPQRSYDVRGNRAVAGRLLQDGPTDDLVELLHGYGRCLRALHAVDPDEVGVDGDGPPRGLARFTTWLDGRAPQPRAAYAESMLRPRLGRAALARLREHTGRIAAAEQVLCHGAPGLGALVIADPGPGADALIGEDLCRAPWWFDLGWTLGELIELQWYLGGNRSAWQRLIDALLRGYGRDLDDRWRDTVALRVLLHVHDYTAYVGWDATVFDKYTGFARYLLSR
ncbi:phosphotransferase [Solwaraspora sp. WMMD791]|uniref:phosphotransferase family protein n=1 Tax=Solwaraspora sp. WMMD791 TaxID=3016086 RepID=UPI00249A9A8C|nr:phosphotransferase [Solwaraspora sp. WMMD791]WFE30322.1 phosphotransferase [Solwaraspora sp. WMMD791]